MKPFEFSHVYVIESLGPDERKTGTELFNDVIRKRMMQRGSENLCELIEINSKSAFLLALETIRQAEIHQLANPIIHFEMHGDENGLQLINNETITWDELQFYLLQLNGICQNNLFVTMATCKGGYIFKAINPAGWSPFWGFVGPFDIVSFGEVIENYSAFYDEFLQSCDFNLAIEALNDSNPSGKSQFRFHNTEYVFQKAYENYELFHLTPVRIEERLEDVLAKCRSIQAFDSWSDQMIRDHLKYLIINENENIKKRMMRKFFLLDKFPEQEEYYEGLL